MSSNGRSGGVDLSAMMGAMRASAPQPQGVDPRELFARRTGVTPLQLEVFGPRMQRCICGGCAGVMLDFTARWHWKDTGTERLPDALATDADKLRATVTEQAAEIEALRAQLSAAPTAPAPEVAP